MTFLRSNYSYYLPEELIAQQPCVPRDHSRLMIIDRAKGTIEHRIFKDILQYLNPGDSFVFNNTKVIPARLYGKRERDTGGKVEVFLSERSPDGSWLALTRPARKLSVGSRVIFSDSFYGDIVEVLDEGVRRVVFHHEGEFEEALVKHGEIPLPHYIHREKKENADLVNYQTMFAKESGAVAAPTAGLHFTPELIEQIDKKGVDRVEVTLHVGLGTFKPVVVDDIRDHKMHGEIYHIDTETANKLNHRKLDKRQICVGTTSCRTLESASDQNGVIIPGSKKTDIFIYPGYEFKYVDALLTNFHLPESTLLMLVSAFAGTELIKDAYNEAVKEKYRFFSYGDAMLIL